MELKQAENKSCDQFARIKKTDDDRRIIYAEVYAPYTLDTYGDMMLPEDIELMAHRFLQIKDLHSTVDTNHDNIPNGSYPIESFIARKGDPDFTEGAWVVGTKVVDDEIWARVKSGELNGYSMQSIVRMVPAVAEVQVALDSVGITEESEGHKHWFYVQLDDEGRVKGGRTSNDMGHVHEIKKGTATEMSYSHAHRFFF